VVGESPLYDIVTQVRVKRPVFSDPVIWSKPVKVPARDAVEVNFTPRRTFAADGDGALTAL